MTDGDATRWARLKALLDEALDLSAPERAALVERTTRDDASLGRELASLLAASDREDGLMAETTLPPEAWADADPAARAAAGQPLPAAIGRYRVRARLGAGGMGEVFLAHDPSLQRDVALKVLPPGLAQRPRRRARFLQEARAAAALNHPSITTIHEIGEADGRDCIAFEYVQGRTLRERLRAGPLPLRELLDVALPLADALAYAHERGVVHRDIKPANVMVTDRGLPKLLDFGLALTQRADDESGADAASDERVAAPGDDSLGGALAGTPSAMSPEQARGEVVDARSDVFAFGSLLFELATGQPAFTREDVAATIEAVLHDEPPRLRTLRPELPAELESIVARALKKDPAARYQHIADLAADLRRLAAGRSRRVPRPVTLAALLALAVSAVVLWRESSAGATAANVSHHDVAAVLDFENVADPQDADRMAAMLGPLLASQLSAAGDLSVISDQRLHDVARQLGHADGRIDRENATDVARRSGADTLVVGRLARVGGSLVATADVVEMESGRTLAALSARGNGAADVFSMADSLGRQVRETLRRPAMSDAERQALAQQLTTSVDAFRAYVRGLEALERDNPQEAAGALGEATGLDPAFALAQFRLSMALIWLGRFDEATTAVQRALAFREKLPANLQSLFDVIQGPMARDETRDALPLLLEIAKQDPYQHDVLYMIGEIYTHSPARGDPRLAAQTYERLLDLDPALSLVYEHQLNAYLRQGRFDLAHERLDAWAAGKPSNLTLLQGEVALWEGRLDDAARLMASPLAPEFLGDRNDAESVRNVLAADVPTLVDGVHEVGVYRVLDLDLRADVLVAHGRFDDAAELYGQAAKVPVNFLSRDGFMASAKGHERVRLAFVLSLLGDSAGARREVEAALDVQTDSPRWLFMSGLFALREGDAATAHERLATVTTVVASPEWSPSGTLYRDALAAEVALAEGRAAEARDGFAAVLASGRLMEDWYCYEDSLGPLVRDGLARACLAAGDKAAASAALAGLIDAGFERLRHPVPWTLALQARGELELELGHVEEGRALLQRFLDHWGKADRRPAVIQRARDLLAGAR